MNKSEFIAAELAKPLERRHIKPPSKFGPKGDYIEGWHAIAEANRIFGWDGWSYDVVSVECVSHREKKIGQDKKDGWAVSYLARIRVTVCGITREDVGTGHGYDVDCGNAHESASKEAVTDALKRCLRTFGDPFGLALYDKEKRNVVDTPEEPKPPSGDEILAAINWIAEAPDRRKLDARKGNLERNKPHLWSFPAVQDAYRARSGQLFPGDDEVAA